MTVQALEVEEQFKKFMAGRRGVMRMGGRGDKRRSWEGEVGEWNVNMFVRVRVCV